MRHATPGLVATDCYSRTEINFSRTSAVIERHFARAHQASLSADRHKSTKPSGGICRGALESIHCRTSPLLTRLIIAMTPRIKQITPMTVSGVSLHAMHHPLPSLNIIQPPTIINQTAITRLNISISPLNLELLSSFLDVLQKTLALGKINRFLDRFTSSTTFRRIDSPSIRRTLLH